MRRKNAELLVAYSVEASGPWLRFKPAACESAAAATLCGQRWRSARFAITGCFASITRGSAIGMCGRDHFA
jgi:hypothetical protein